MHHAGFRMVYPCSMMIFMGLRKVYWFCFVAAVTSDRWDGSMEHGVLMHVLVKSFSLAFCMLWSSPYS